MWGVSTTKMCAKQQFKSQKSGIKKGDRRNPLSVLMPPITEAASPRSKELASVNTTVVLLLLLGPPLRMCRVLEGRERHPQSPLPRVHALVTHPCLHWMWWEKVRKAYECEDEELLYVLMQKEPGRGAAKGMRWSKLQTRKMLFAANF